MEDIETSEKVKLRVGDASHAAEQDGELTAGDIETQKESAPKEQLDTIHTALPRQKYYFLRAMRLAGDIFLGLLAFVFVATFFTWLLQGLGVKAPFGRIYIGEINYAAIYLTYWFSVSMMGVFRTAYDWDIAKYGLRLADRNGNDLTKRQRELRSAIYAFTWFLLPVHLCIVAAGGRRFLHDYASGAFVLYGKQENPSTTFYPAQKKSLTLSFLVVCLLVLSMNKTIRQAYDGLESTMLPALVGSQSQIYLWYLDRKYANVDRSFRTMSAERARQLKPQIIVMCSLQQRYFGVEDARTARFMLLAAMISARAGDTASTNQFVGSFLALPVGLQQGALLSGDIQAYAWRQDAPTFCRALVQDSFAYGKMP